MVEIDNEPHGAFTLPYGSRIHFHLIKTSLRHSWVLVMVIIPIKYMQYLCFFKKYSKSKFHFMTYRPTNRQHTDQPADIASLKDGCMRWAPLLEYLLFKIISRNYCSSVLKKKTSKTFEDFSPTYHWSCIYLNRQVLLILVKWTYLVLFQGVWSNMVCYSYRFTTLIFKLLIPLDF